MALYVAVRDYKRKRLLVAFSGFLAIATLLAYLTYVLTRPAFALPADDFVTTWKTDNAGSSNSTSITIPTTGGGYNYDVDWNNDGNFDEFGITSDVTHDFGVSGTYTIRIQGAFPRIYFNNTGDRQKILDVNQWGTGAWSSMGFAFYGATNLSVSASDAPNLSSSPLIYGMFAEASSFNSSINHWDVSTVTNMDSMFSEAANFNQPLDNWDVGNVTSMGNMFRGAAAFNQSLDSWDMTSTLSTAAMFQNATSFNQPLSSWDTSSITNLSSMFYAASAFNQALNSWDVSNVMYTSYMFNNATAFNQPLNSWDTSSVIDMYSMFAEADSFNQSLASWDVSNVISAGGMFYGTNSFNGDVSTWDTSSVTDMTSMFAGAAAFNQPIGAWNLSNVTSISQMITFAPLFDQDISSWDVSNVTSMSYFLREADAFNQDISGWDTSSVTDMSNMLADANSFNQPIGAWNVSNVTTMERLLQNASSFNQDLSGWDMTSVTNLGFALDYTALSLANYDATLTGWAAQSLQSGVTLGAAGLEYCAAETDRQFIIDSFGWTITGDSEGCPDPSDSDGVDNAAEAGAPNGGDGNDDDTPDSEQPNVGSLPNLVVDGGAYLTLESSSPGSVCNTITSMSHDEAIVNDSSFTYPLGITSFALSCNNPNDSTTITIYYDQLYDSADWVARKYDSNTQAYSTVAGASFGSFNQNGTPVTTLTYTIADGDALDEDGVADGTIVDPVGPGIPIVTQQPGLQPGPGAPNSGAGTTLGLSQIVTLLAITSAIISSFVVARRVLQKNI